MDILESCKTLENERLETSEVNPNRKEYENADAASSNEIYNVEELNIDICSDPITTETAEVNPNRKEYENADAASSNEIYNVEELNIDICSDPITTEEADQEPIQIESTCVIQEEKFSNAIEEASENYVSADSDQEAQNEFLRKVKQVYLDQDEKSNEEFSKSSYKKKEKRQKTLTIIDSDSENESGISKEFISDLPTHSETNKFEQPNKLKVRKRITTVIDTDSYSDDITPHNKSFNSVISRNKGLEPKTLSILDNDYQTESTNFSQNTVDNITKNAFNNDKIQGELDLVNTDSEAEDVAPQNTSFIVSIDSNKNTKEEGDFSTSELFNKIDPGARPSVQKSRLAMLCDSESDEEPSSEEPNYSHISDDEIVEQPQHARNIKRKSNESTINKKNAKSSTKSPRAKNTDTTKKMTPREAAEQRKEIRSESQRMTREKNVSLPYHKPKARSLKEFLTRRPRLAVEVPNRQAPPSIAIKMSTEQLEIISKQLKEREKEVKEFYQSESESEHDDDLDYVPPTSDVNKTDEGAKETAILPLEENYINIGAQEDISKNAEEDNRQQERPEAESIVAQNDNFQETEEFPNIIDSCGDLEHPTDKSAATELSTPEDEPMEANNLSQRDQNKDVMGDQDKMANNNLSAEISTESYDFSLDDENIEKVASLNNTGDCQPTSNLKESLEPSDSKRQPETSEPQQKPPSKPFIYNELDMEIENYGNADDLHDNITEEDLVDKPPTPPVKSKLEMLKEKLGNIQPRLSGGPDKVIDLDSTLAKPKEVVELMERFTKHMTSKKHNSKHKVKLSIVTVESGGDIHKETVALNVDDDEAEVQEEKPGAKMRRLREELQKQMDQKKSELWQQKAARGIRGSEEIYEGKAVDGEQNKNDEKELLDDEEEEEEEEEEMTDEEDTEEEIESDIDLRDKPSRKSGFLDQEAEESGNEETVHEADYEEDILNEEEEVEYEERGNSEKDDEDSNTTNEPLPPLEPEHESSIGKKRVLKRILKPDDDSDEEDLFSPDAAVQKPNSLEEQLDSTVTADEEDIPPHQTRQLHTPMRQAESQTKSISDFLTPISFITSIINLASATKSKTGPAISPFRMPLDQSSTAERLASSQKKLFDDSETTDTQGSLSTLVAQVKDFSAEPGQDNETMTLRTTEIEEDPCTQDLIGICSGEFTGVTQLEPSDEPRKMIEFDGSQSSELKSLGTDQDMVISQLLDEEELENFKKKFESPIHPITQNNGFGESQEISGGGIIDSDDENQVEFGQRKKTNQRRIQFSDDDTSDEESNQIEEEIDLQDNDDEEIDNIGYDSEENEIDLNEIGKKQKMKLADFLEAEAELSESEWGSEDEDEKGLDQLEFELGDTEKFDEEQVKEDLNKIHLRRMLDDDAREVKLLQEVYLEDGEMHGTGRQRQFKWKNIDLNDDQTEETRDEDDIFFDAEVSEEQWRKNRHEREMFLKEKQHKSQHGQLEDGELLIESQLLKIGQKVLQRSQSNSQNNSLSDMANVVSDEPISKAPFSLLSKRGSFLSRSDQVLQRVAEYTKISAGVNSTKTTKNFVFQSVSLSEDLESSAENKKRKALEGTPNVIKKLRLDTNLSPAANKKTERSKKLFNF